MIEAFGASAVVVVAVSNVPPAFDVVHISIVEYECGGNEHNALMMMGRSFEQEWRERLCLFRITPSVLNKC